MIYVVQGIWGAASLSICYQQKYIMFYLEIVAERTR